MKYEIEIPDGVIPEDYEPVSFRPAESSDTAIDDKGHAHSDCAWNSSPRLILRKRWQWPEWLDAEELRWGGNYWIARMTGPDGIPIMWSIMWEVINYPQPPNKSRVYTNPRKNVKGGE